MYKLRGMGKEAIRLKNPITIIEISRMVEVINAIHNPQYLSINFGDHNFVSIEVLKYCKIELLKIEDLLKNFQKIAFISPSDYIKANSNTENLRCFISEKEAEIWFFNQVQCY